MSGTDKNTDEDGDEILRRMLKTPPQPKEGEKEKIKPQEDEKKKPAD